MLLLTLLIRDLRLNFAHPGSLFNPLLFFLITVSLFPFALGTESALLQEAGPGIIWVAALLSGMLSLPFLLEEDYQDGSLEQMLLSNVFPPFIIASKILSHWLTTALPLIAIAPLLGLMLSLPANVILGLTLSLALGTPSLSMIGVISASLILGSKKGSSLIALITLPFTIPILIFGAIASMPEDASLSGTAYLLLSGFLLIFAPVSLIAGALGIQSAIRYR